GSSITITHLPTKSATPLALVSKISPAFTLANSLGSSSFGRTFDCSSRKTSRVTELTLRTPHSPILGGVSIQLGLHPESIFSSTSESLTTSHAFGTLPTGLSLNSQ